MAQLLFILAIGCFALDTFTDWLDSGAVIGRLNWTAAGLCLFAIAIYLA